ncbi:RNA polymerase sigma-70 factor [Diaphorobacter sp. HDW4A]|uniref:RNA polymerase sigma-70 factor n=1 Tax=Diaphorobacter sp. HDW4A TaxID=2714924 RepID=UPI00140DF6CF|nr:RNA polymerase sigma-70 factor [Diaphorobacter sp. HDW4A]QIL83179.1 RNA polymerase sigma-70 factor [Diaphorobacter sp. HDW4A]
MEDESTTIFEGLRKRLQGIAYRMLGSVAEAEDVVQDVWLRWHDAHRSGIANAEAWLVTTTTRASIDHLRSAKVRRESYVGFWLPEPLLADSPPSPEQELERANDLSVAFLTVLERLSPDARAAFLMREVFDAEYIDIASILGTSEASSRQLVSRSRVRLREEGAPRYKVSADAQFKVLRRFSDAMSSGDFAALKFLLAEDAELVSDGGGKVTSFPKPLSGSQRIAQLYFSAHRRYQEALRIELAVINGQWGTLRFIDGQLESVHAYETDGERIVHIHVQRNPDKLARIAVDFLQISRGALSQDWPLERLVGVTQPLLPKESLP